MAWALGCRLGGSCAALWVLVGLAGASREATTRPATTGPAAAAEDRPDLLAPVTRDGRPVAESILVDQSARRAAELLAEADKASNPKARASAALTAAEFILARQLEPALSRELLGLATPGDRTFVRERARAVTRLLDKAEASSSQRASDETAEEQDRLDVVRAYAGLFAAWPLGDPDAAAPAALVDACRRLAPMLDASQADAASSARLWQGAAYRRAGKVDRALQVLPRPAGQPRALAFDFFGRIERCRALVQHGEQATALAMLIRMEPRIHAWFEEEDRPAALCALLLAQEQAWERWADAMPASAGPDAAGARASATALRRRRQELERGAYRLGLAIGGVRAPLPPAHAPAAAFGIACDVPSITIVLDPSGVEAGVWQQATAGVAGLLRTMESAQSFALVAPAADGLRSFPTSPFATAHGSQASGAVEFLANVQPTSGRTERLGDALLRALALKPNAVLLLTAQGIEESLAQDLVRLARESNVRFHLIWLGAAAPAEGLREVAVKSGGEFRKIAGTPAPASAPEGPADTTNPATTQPDRS